METETRRNTLCYRLAVNGVFGRNRKVKYDSHRLLQVDASAPVTAESLQGAIDEKLAEIRLRPGGQWVLWEDPVEVKTYKTDTDREVKIECHVLLSGKQLVTGHVI